MYWQKSKSQEVLSLRSNGLVIGSIKKEVVPKRKDPRGFVIVVTLEGTRVEQTPWQSYEEAKEWMKLAVIARLLEAETIQRPD